MTSGLDPAISFAWAFGAGERHPSRFRIHVNAHQIQEQYFEFI